MTLDGDTVAIVDLQPDASQFTSTQGVFEVAPSRGFSETTAHDLRNAFGEARDEQLVELLESATMTRAARTIVASVTATRPAQNAAADEVNALVDQAVALEDQYDAVVTEYNAVVSNAHALYDAISAVPRTASAS